MFKSYRVGTIYGIPFKLDITFVLILPVFAVLLGLQIGAVVPTMNALFGTAIDPGPLTSGMRPFLVGFIAAVALFGCVTLHELGHSVAAIYYGYEVESITLWLLGGIAKPAELPQNWHHEFWIAVAGPLVNVTIVAVCGAIFAVVPPNDLLVFLLIYLALLNVGLVIFNMLPAFPLDGGRILRALLARNRPYLEATRIAAAIGKAFAILLGLVGLLSLDFFFMAIALFVYIAATSETHQMMLDAAFKGLSIEEVMTPAEELATVEADDPVTAVRDILRQTPHQGFPVVENGAFVGTVTLETLQTTSQKNRAVRDVMIPVAELTSISPERDVATAFRAVTEGGIDPLPVINEGGELLGLITRMDLLHASRALAAGEQFDELGFDDLRLDEQIVEGDGSTSDEGGREG